MDNFSFFFQDVYGTRNNKLIIDFQYEEQLYKCMVSEEEIKYITNNVITTTDQLKEVLIKAKENRDGWAMTLTTGNYTNLVFLFKTENFILIFELTFKKVRKCYNCMPITIGSIVIFFFFLILYIILVK